MRTLSAPQRWGGSPALAGLSHPAAPKVLLRNERATRWSWRLRLPLDRPPPLMTEVALTIAVLLAAATLGAVRGGHLDAFVADHGGLGDFAARHLGFGVSLVTVSGAAHMREQQVLELAGISPKSSVPFFDIGAARAKLEAYPLIKRASVRKLYPNQIVIDIVERTPYGVWQQDGHVRAIAADGAPVDETVDVRYVDLPFVVGPNANLRVKDFVALLDAMAELKPRVEAGILIGERRWTLKLKSGLEIKLPEVEPEAAIERLLNLQRQSRILDRDILALDLRAPDRAFVRLSQDAADFWAQAHAPKKGASP